MLLQSSISDTQPKVNLPISKTNEVSDSPKLDSHYKQKWLHERNRRIEVEQENIRLRKIIYNTKFSPIERIVAIEIADQVKESKHVDEQGRKLVNQTQAADKLEVDRSTIHTAMKVLIQSGFITDKETSSLKDADGKKVRSKDGNPIYTTHLSIDQDLLEDFSKAKRSEPRKIKENRKKPVYACKECGTEDVTIKETKSLVCKNPNCKKCGHEVFIEASYTEQKSDTKKETPEEDQYSAEIFNTIELLDNSAEIFNTIELLDNSAEIFNTTQTDDKSNNPPPSASAALDHDSIIEEWVHKRRGTSQVIKATEKPTQQEKYTTLPESYIPDIPAYIQGKIEHIYGSKLVTPKTGRTQVLCFDVDYHDPKQPDPQWLEQAQNWLVDFRRAGVTAVYWQRGKGGHFEIYFDQPVYPERARYWAYSICPDLEEIAECYPCQDKANSYLSWPMWQRKGYTVESTLAHVLLPEPYEGELQTINPTDKEALTKLITIAVTPAALVEEYARVADQQREQGKSERAGGVIGLKPQGIMQVQGERDLAKQVIANFNALHSWDDIAAMCGGWDGNYFKAVWRGERSASVTVNRDGVLAHDYGRSGGYPSTFDQYQAYCLIHGIDKRVDLAERCAQLRRQQGVPMDKEREALESFVKRVQSDIPALKDARVEYQRKDKRHKNEGKSEVKRY